jgi:protein-S-isoprenylcysteine O-methyltransferase Ste14
VSNGAKPLIELGFSAIALRIYLFSGLLLHKIVWEALKIRDRKDNLPKKKREGGLLKLIKLTKISILAFLVIQTLALNVFPILEHPGPLRVLGTAIFTLGLAIAILGRLNLGKNWADLEDYQTLPGQSVVTHGIYRFVRHPIYAGDFLLILGLELALNSWLLLGVLFLLIVIIRQSLAEEAVLSRAFPDYEAYRAGTKMFIPFIY